VSTLAHSVVVADAFPIRHPGTLYVLHGFLGSGRNWMTIARRLVDLRPDWRVILVDLRLHGDSRGLAVPGPDTVASCAEDVLRLHERISRRDQPVALLGHSFGGKVALIATSVFRPPPIQTWVMDSTPEPSPGDGSSAKMLELLSLSPAQFAGRDDAVEWLQAGGFDESTARWMAMSLHRTGESLAWKFDIPGLKDLSADFARIDLWPIVESPPEGTDIRFVQAEAGSILSADAYARLEAIEGGGEAVSVRRLAGGHWLHIDNPIGLVEMVAAELPRS